MTIEGAHTKGTEVGSLVFSVDGRTVMTRGGDDTVKCRLVFIVMGPPLLTVAMYSVGPTSVQEASGNPIWSGDAISYYQRHL